MRFFLLFALLLTGSFSAVAVPEIVVTGNGANISDGDNVPVAANFTDFGNQSICAGITTVTFIIQNSGADPLNISSVTISGADAGEFSIVTFPASTVLAGGNTTLEVSFNPSSVGLKNAVITINNDDGDEAVFDFAIQGTGTDPEINVTGNGNNINDGSGTPSGSNHTGFGPVLVCIGTNTRTYTISNSGTGNLVIGVGGITLTGTHAFDYSVGGISLPASIPPGGSTTFTVTTDPSGTGNRFATVNIASNDCDEGTYDFAIQTNGQADVTPPVAPALSPVTDECSVTLSVPAATDNCAGVVSGTTTTVFPITAQGTTVVTWSFNDGNGNTTQVNQTVIIDDVTQPVVSDCPSTITETVNSANCSATVSWTAPSAMDNCAASPLMTASHNPGTDFPLGTTPVTYTFDDGNGNSATCAFDVVVISNLNATASLTGITCYGSATGAIDLTVSGSSGYTFDWNSGLYTTQNISALSQGTYTVVVTDGYDCEFSDTFTLADPAELVVTVDGTTGPTTCASSDGMAEVSISGGTVSGACQTEWTDGGSYTSNLEDPADLTDGVFMLTVTDDNGCEATTSVSLADPNGPAITLNVASDTTLSCYGDSDGSIDIDVTFFDGATTATYDWNGGTYTTEDISGLVAGSYTVTAYDNNSCSTMAMFTVSEPVEVVATAISGGATVTAGNSSGTYQWIDCATMAAVAGATGQSFSPASNGSYAVIVTEGACSDTSSCVVVDEVGIVETNEALISVFPNPSGGLFNLLSPLAIVKLELVDLSGKKLVEETQHFQQIDLSQLENGVYLLHVVTEGKREQILRLLKE